MERSLTRRSRDLMSMARNLPRAHDGVNTSGLDDRTGHSPEGMGISHEGKERHNALFWYLGQHTV